MHHKQILRPTWYGPGHKILILVTYPISRAATFTKFGTHLLELQ